MVIDELSSNEMIGRELGARLREVRIAFPLTQSQLASRAGVSRRTVANLEKGADVTTGSLISVLRALGLLSRMDLLVPEREPHPLELLNQAPRRQRVRASRGAEAASGWKWGDEQ